MRRPSRSSLRSTSFFASFPIVFFEIYGLPLNTGNLPYLRCVNATSTTNTGSICIGGALFCAMYIALIYFYVECVRYTSE